MGQCPNVTPGANCVDPDCTYCRIADAESPASKIVHWPLGAQSGVSQSAWHWCPACERLHPIPDSGWTRSGSVEAPTYSPSFLQHTTRGPCHYWIRDGKLIYCGDSFHRMADQTVDLPHIPKRVMADLTDEIFRR